MLFEYSVNTQKEELLDVTDYVKNAVAESKVMNGICVVFTPYTTAGVIVSNNSDPAVSRDVLFSLSQAIPYCEEFDYLDGTSTAHIKSALVGPDKTILIEDGRLLMGTWQAVKIAEFGGPRRRRFYVKILEG